MLGGEGMSVNIPSTVLEGRELCWVLWVQLKNKDLLKLAVWGYNDFIQQIALLII